ncbi:MAG: DUF4244 domain-containing protein [Marmoricola sp.]
MHNNTLSLSSIRNDVGTTTAEYAVCTGAATGFGCLLYKFLTSEQGQDLIRLIFGAVKGMLPF